MNKVTQEMIQGLINASVLEYTTLGNKTTLVRIVLPCGFELIETSTCLDPANYDENMGRDIALAKIVDKLWELEGYRMAWARHGEGGAADDRNDGD